MTTWNWTQDRAQGESLAKALLTPEHLLSKRTKKNEYYRYLDLKALSIERFLSKPFRPAGGANRIEVSTHAATVLSLNDDRAIPVLDRFSKEMGGIGHTFCEDGFAQLARSRWQQGILIHVPPDVQIVEPLRCQIVFDDSESECIFRIVVIVEEGASLSCVFEYQGRGAEQNVPIPTVVGLTECVLERNAQLKTCVFQNWGDGVGHLIRDSVWMGEGAQAEWVSAAVGGRIGQWRLDTECAGPGSSIRVRAAVRGRGEQKVDCWVTSRHGVSDTSAQMDFWNVMGDRSQATFNGNVIITPQGVRTDAYQKNKNILLSPDARVHTLPKLEIATDDVKCAHGASVSPISDDQIYYLMSRGISRGEAEQMIIDGFTDPVVSMFPVESLRERVREALSLKNLGDLR